MLKMKFFWLIFRGKFEQKTQKSIFLKNQWRLKNIKKAMVVKNIIAEDMPFTKSIFEQFWRSYCKKTIFVVFHFLKFLPKRIIHWTQKDSRQIPDKAHSLHPASAEASKGVDTSKPSKKTQYQTDPARTAKLAPVAKTMLLLAKPCWYRHCCCRQRTAGTTSRNHAVDEA